MKQEIILKPIDELIPYINNPKQHPADQVDKIASSIKNYGFTVPMVIDGQNEIIMGHGRLQAAKKLGMEEVPCIVRDDLTESQVKALRIADNKVSESEWDIELLEIELETIEGFTGFECGEIDNLCNDNDYQGENIYTKKVDVPLYEIKGECPSEDELTNHAKVRELVTEIEQSDISDKQKQFLLTAANRHTVFDYSKIAEYYAHADSNIQRLMEKSALIIIDYDDAIRSGYVHLSNEIAEIVDDLGCDVE